MQRRALLALIPLLFAGCLTPFTRRLDLANERAAAIHQQLVVATAKLDEATATLERSEQQVKEASATLRRMENKLDEIERRAAVIEQGFRKMFGIKGPLPEEEE